MKYHCVTLKTLETHWNSCINDGNVNAVVEIREILRHLPKDCCLVSFSHPVLIGSRTLREQRGYPQLKPELVPTQCCHPVLIGSWALGVQSGYPQQTPQLVPVQCCHPVLIGNWALRGYPLLKPELVPVQRCHPVLIGSGALGEQRGYPELELVQCSAVTQCSLVARHSENKEATPSWSRNWYQCSAVTQYSLVAQSEDKGATPSWSRNPVLNGRWALWEQRGYPHLKQELVPMQCSN